MSVLYIIFGFGLFFVGRIFFPMIWIFDHINDLQNEAYSIALAHLMFLFFMLIFLIIFLIKSIRFTKKHIYEFQYNDCMSGSIRKNIRYLLVFFLVLVVANLDDIAFFNDGGSDAIMMLGEKNKVKTWLLYSVFNIITVSLLVNVFLSRSKLRDIFFTVLTFLVAGKKSALIKAIMYIITLVYIKNPHKKIPARLFLYFTIFLLATMFFAQYVYLKTLHNAVEIADLIDAPIRIMHLLKVSLSSYLGQFILQGGFYYAEDYSNSLGDYSFLVYYFNSFTKVLFGTGVDMSIGPYMTYKLTGSTIPNGVNPTVFFEYFFLSNSVYIAMLSCIHMYFIFRLAFWCYKKLVLNMIQYKISLTIFYFLCFQLSLSSLFDTTNAIRSLPIVFFPLVFHYLKYSTKGVFK